MRQTLLLLLDSVLLKILQQRQGVRQRERERETERKRERERERPGVFFLASGATRMQSPAPSLSFGLDIIAKPRQPQKWPDVEEQSAPLKRHCRALLRLQEHMHAAHQRGVMELCRLWLWLQVCCHRLHSVSLAESRKSARARARCHDFSHRLLTPQGRTRNQCMKTHCTISRLELSGLS